LNNVRREYIAVGEATDADVSKAWRSSLSETDA
jgi:hypothetical protein